MTEQSVEIGELCKALAAAQSEIEGAVKDATNPHFKSRYADLASCMDAIRVPLSSRGLCYVQTTEIGDPGRLILATTLMHASGQWIRGRISIRPVKDDPQGMGSALTYARRYGLCAIVGLAQIDDDGEAASGGMGRAPVRKEARSMPPPKDRPPAVNVPLAKPSDFPGPPIGMVTPTSDPLAIPEEPAKPRAKKPSKADPAPIGPDSITLANWRGIMREDVGQLARNAHRWQSMICAEQAAAGDGFKGWPEFDQALARLAWKMRKDRYLGQIAEYDAAFGKGASPDSDRPSDSAAFDLGLSAEWRKDLDSIKKVRDKMKRRAASEGVKIDAEVF